MAAPAILNWPSSIRIKTITEGDQVNKPRKGDKVVLHYIGPSILDLENGTESDPLESTPELNQPFKTEIGMKKVIRAWDEAVLQMTLGQKIILIAPPDSAYGIRGAPPDIPPSSTLKFVIELLRIIRKGEPDEG